MPFILVFYVEIREKEKTIKVAESFLVGRGGEIYIVIVYIYKYNNVRCHTNNVPWDLFDVILYLITKRKKLFQKFKIQEYLWVFIITLYTS